MFQYTTKNLILRCTKYMKMYMGLARLIIMRYESDCRNMVPKGFKLNEK